MQGFIVGELDLEEIQSALQSALGLLENDGSEVVEAVRLVEADVEVTRATWAWDDLSSLPVRTGEYDQTGSLTTAWLTDPTSTIGTVLAESSGGVSSWLLSDPPANVTAAVATTGSTVTGTRALDAFGNARTAATGSLATQQS